MTHRDIKREIEELKAKGILPRKRALTDSGQLAADEERGVRPKTAGAPPLEASEEAASWDVSQNSLCAYGVNCKRYDCWLEHPDGRVIDEDPNLSLCRFGVDCTRMGCIYKHPEGRHIDEERWHRFAVFLDEFSIPRGKLHPPESACEVFVDPLPGKIGDPELDNFLRSFVNDDSEVVKVDFLGEQERGYVLFANHAAALACVGSGAGVWSESEFALSEKLRMKNEDQRKKNRWLLLRRLHKELPMFMSTSGVFELKLNHDNKYSAGNPDHVHFSGKGTQAQIRAFRPLVEEIIAKFHEDFLERQRPRMLRMWGFPDVWTEQKVLMYFEQYGTVKYLKRLETGSLDVSYRVAKDAELAFRENDSLGLGGDGNKVRCELLEDTSRDDEVKIDYTNFHSRDSAQTATAQPKHRPRPSQAPHLQKSLLEPSSSHKLSEEKVRVNVKNCPPELDSLQMLKLFANFGTVQSTVLRTDVYGKCSGSGVVEFCTIAEATAAVEALNGTLLHEREISVAIRTPQLEPPPGDFSETTAPPGDFSEAKDSAPPANAQEEEDIELLIEERNKARKNKDWTRADEIRDLLKEAGVVLMDERGPAGQKHSATEFTQWRYWRE